MSLYLSSSGSRQAGSSFALEDHPPPLEGVEPWMDRKLNPFTGIIDRILEDDRTSHRKQRHTARRIFDRLRDEYGFTGGYTIVKDYVRGRQLRSREVFVPLVHPPGHAQADFGEAMAVIGGVLQKIHFLAFDLPHSDGCFVAAYPADLLPVAGDPIRSPHFGFLAQGLQLTGEFPEVIGLSVDQEAVFQATSFEDCQAFWVRITFDPEKIAIEVNTFNLGVVPNCWVYRFKENLKLARQLPFIPCDPEGPPDPVVPTTTVQAGQPIAVESGDRPG